MLGQFAHAAAGPAHGVTTLTGVVIQVYITCILRHENWETPKNTEMFSRHPYFSATHFCESVNDMYLPL